MLLPKVGVHEGNLKRPLGKASLVLNSYSWTWYLKKRLNSETDPARGLSHTNLPERWKTLVRGN